MIRTNINEFNERFIGNIIQSNNQRKAEFEENWEMYLNSKETEYDPDLNKIKPCISAPYCSYIVDFLSNYVVGNAITYSVNDERYQDLINKVMDNNEEDYKNNQIAIRQGAQGAAFEIVYFDEETKEIKFDRVNAEEMILVFDTSINPKLKLAIRDYQVENPFTKKETFHVEVYGKDSTKYYTRSGNNLKLDQEIINPFSEIPVIYYPANEDEKPDFQKVKQQIKAYTKRITNNSEEIDYTKNAYLYVAGLDLSENVYNEKDEVIGTKADLIKKQGIINIPNPAMDSACEVKFITKDVNDQFIENELNRLNQDIHKFSGIPDLNDKQFAGNSSGVALEQKFMGLEQKAKEKETLLKRGLIKRLKLITEGLSLLGEGSFDYKSVRINFTFNKPIDETSLVDNAIKLQPVLDDKANFGRLPQVEDVNVDLKDNTNIEK